MVVPHAPIRSLAGKEIPFHSIRLPDWCWQYFRPGGGYMYVPILPGDPISGRTRTAAGTPAAAAPGTTAGTAATAAAVAATSGASRLESSICMKRAGEDGGSVSERSVASTATSEPGAYKHLLHDVLMYSGAIEELLYFVSECKCHVLAYCRVGGHLCGHKGIVHGGFTAAFIDNALGVLGHAQYTRSATKSLNIKYIRPFAANSSVLLDACVQDINQRICTVSGTLLGPIPERFAANFAGRQQQQQQQQRGSLATLPPIADGFWVVASVSGELVDVTEAWKGI